MPHRDCLRWVSRTRCYVGVKLYAQPRHGVVRESVTSPVRFRVESGPGPSECGIEINDQEKKKGCAKIKKFHATIFEKRGEGERGGLRIWGGGCGVGNIYGGEAEG